MDIDKITFVAQIINLIVLVWLLKRFLYKPIIQAVDKRQSAILKKITDANAEYKKWQEASEKLRQKELDFENERNRQLQNVLDEVKTLKAEKTAELHQFKKESEERIKQELILKKETFESQLSEIGTQSVLFMLQQIARDFGVDTSSEKTLLLFQKELKHLSADEKKQFAHNAENFGIIQIESAIKLTDVQKQKLQEILKLFLKNEKHYTFKFSLNKELAFGFRIQSGSFVANWNIFSYFNKMKDEFNLKIKHKINGETVE
ncbi:MAG: F0F1 ATP synthase subunit delta [Alphaproteobacteria bacterium]|nr:F0F1 ATP synthase subunit delta [Alphaproteobacteria bacterium]MBQ8557510.1 F0F1 ATP synthase subunit delta [Alphaproteobacteria bacterium]